MQSQTLKAARFLALALVTLSLQGCVAEVVGGAVGGVGKIAGTTVGVAGHVAGAGVHAVAGGGGSGAPKS